MMEHKGVLFFSALPKHHEAHSYVFYAIISKGILKGNWESQSRLLSEKWKKDVRMVLLVFVGKQVEM